MRKLIWSSLKWLEINLKLTNVIIILIAPCFWYYVFVIWWKRNHHEYLGLNRKWHNLNLVKSGVYVKALPAPPLRGACLVHCTGHTSVCHSATDAIDTFQCRRVQFLELYTLVFLNCLQLSIFRGVTQSFFAWITWVKNLCFSERKSKTGDNFHNHVELVPSGNIYFFRIFMHTTPVSRYWCSSFVR